MSPTTSTDPLPPLPGDPQDPVQGALAHWRATRRLTLVLMSLWLCTGLVTVFFARELSRFTVFGWPLSFYMAAQGASLVSLAIIALYAWRMRRLDRLYPAAAQGGA